MIPLELLANISQCILGTALVKFVDGDNIREIQHVDFFELGCRTKFRCHHIQRNIAVIHDFCVALTDATRLENDQIKFGRL